MHSVILLASLFLTCYCDDQGRPEWGYDQDTGPEMWPALYKNCGGKNQSPINIEKDRVTINPNLVSLTFVGYQKALTGSTIANNGHTVEITPNPQDYYAIRGGGLTGTYRLQQCHFHWGSAPTQGSEHTVDYKRYPLEAHCVHRNEKYSTMKQALNNTDGLAVLAILFQVSASPNPALQTITQSLNSVRYAHTQQSFDLDNPLRSLFPRNIGSYVRYFGSLTTPECNEVVTWFVFMKKQKVTSAQLLNFVTLVETPPNSKEEVLLVNNFRPLQNIGSRIVKGSKYFHQ